MRLPLAMYLNLRNKAAAVVSGLSLIIFASVGLGLLGSGSSPSLISPLPTLTVLPALLLASQFGNAALFKAVVLLPTLLFFAWNPSLLRGEAKVPKRSHWLLWTAIALSVAYFIASWNWGIQYQGVRYVHAVCAINVAWASFLGIMFVFVWTRPTSFRVNLFVHWILFAWLAWYAFPLLGELL